MNPLRTKVKMCGMTRTEDIKYAADLGVDAFGLIFAEESPRYLSLDKAQALCKNLPPFISPVAVLVNPDRQFVQQVIKELPIAYLQFHGEETNDFCAQFNKPFIKCIRPENTLSIQQAAQDYSDTVALLLDTVSDKGRGGTGLSFDWQIIPDSLTKPVILAGGLNPEKVQHAVQTCAPFAVDVCSGVETMPGVKDHVKMSQFMKGLWGN